MKGYSAANSVASGGIPATESGSASVNLCEANGRSCWFATPSVTAQEYANERVVSRLYGERAGVHAFHAQESSPHLASAAATAASTRCVTNGGWSCFLMQTCHVTRLAAFVCLIVQQLMPVGSDCGRCLPDASVPAICCSRIKL